MPEDKSDDEEISIDFSKVKNLFKKKKNIEKEEEKVKEEVEEAKEKIEEEIEKEKEHIKELKEKEAEVEHISDDIKQEENDDEVNIDFSKVKNIFKKKEGKESKPEKSESSDEFNLDFGHMLKATGDFFVKNKILLLLLIPILLSIFFRIQSAYLPITDEWAQNSIENNLRGSIESQINSQYPNLPAANKEALVESNLKKALKEQKVQVDQQVKSTSQYFKSRMQDEDGQTYLLAIDPYLWYGETRNYLEHGHFGDEFKDGESWYSLRNGRPGKKVESFASKGTSIVNQYIGVYLYKIMHLFNRNVSLMGAFFLIPLIIVTLSIIPAFFIGKKLGGPIAGLFAGIIVAINAALLGRTPAGFSDTDPYNVFFPLFIAWAFIEAVEAKDLKKKLIFSGIAGLLVGIFSRAWSGWWYPMLFVVGALGISLLYYIITNFKELKKGFKNFILIPKIKNTLIILGTFFGSSALFVILLNDIETFINGVLEPLIFIRLKEVAVTTLWPNVLTTVAEFNEVPLGTIMSQMGGKLLFLIAIIGIVLMAVMKNKDGKRDIMYASFIAIWFIGTIYAFTKGTRFAILMVPAFAIAFGIAIGYAYNYASKLLADGFHINKYASRIIIILLLSLLLISPFKAATATAKNEIPSMNDAWYDSLTAIRDDSEDAIITSWWDFGHWFVAIAERKVTFDGADQGKRIHYVGKSLLVEEEESVAILKMLNCGQNEGPFLLEDYFDGDTPKATDIINEIMFYDKAKAVERLKEEGLDDEQIENLTILTHCDDLIPQYYITSQDMIGKAGVWGHFGSWDFHKAKMHNYISKNSYSDSMEFLQQEFDMSEDEANKQYYEIQSADADRWISPWPGYMGGPYSTQIIDNVARCSNGIEVNLTSLDVRVPTQAGIQRPASIVYATKNGLEEKKFEDGTQEFSLALIPSGKSYQCLMLDPLLAKGAFTQLFFFEGHGSRYFELFSEQNTFTGQKIQVWKVNWEPGKMILMDELEPKTNVKQGNEVSVFYIGWTEQDGVFDSSIIDWQEKSITPQTSFTSDYLYRDLSFEVGAGRVIKGFDDAVIGMKINQTKTIEIPPEEAYGTDPNAHPLGNKTLFFKIKVVDIS